MTDTSVRAFVVVAFIAVAAAAIVLIVVATANAWAASPRLM
jgi:hypothetical protein